MEDFIFGGYFFYFLLACSIAAALIFYGRLKKYSLLQNNYIFLLGILLCVIVISGSSLYAGAFLLDPNRQDLIRIAVAIDMGGKTWSIGREQQIGLDIARDEFGEKLKAFPIPVILVDYDTGHDPDDAARVFAKLTRDTERIVAIIGPSTSRQALKADIAADKARIPVIAPSNTMSGFTTLDIFPNRYISRVSAPVDQVARRSVQKVMSLKSEAGEKFKKVIIAYADDVFCESEYRSFNTELKIKGIEVPNPIKFSLSDTDFSKYIKENIIPNNPDGVVISGLGETHGNFIKQLRANNYKNTIIIGNGLNFPHILLKHITTSTPINKTLILAKLIENINITQEIIHHSFLHRCILRSKSLSMH
jgi:ABC-type branched-subunit amino acid transport system substrate-binding protein